MEFHKIFLNKYENWSELEKDIELIKTPREKGNVFEQFALLYFEYYRKLYMIDDMWFNYSEIPEEIKIKLRLDLRDSGVDGIIRRKTGELVAVQCKFRKDQQPPTYRELTTFWAESEYADERCIFANSYELPDQSDKKSNQFVILRGELTNLDNKFFEWLHIRTNDEETYESPQKYQPFPHQEKIINEVVKGFESSDRGKLLAACGTGKTLTSLWIKEKLEAKLTLFVAPNLALIKQTLESWMPQANNDFIYLCVCSDESVASTKNSLDAELDEMSFIDVPVTTDKDKIKSFFDFKTDFEKVIFSTYQSLDSIIQANNEVGGMNFDIAFFDEAHRTAGNKDTNMFTMGMTDDFIPINKRLFMTATERYVNPRIIERAANHDLEVFSMDDSSQYGPTFTTLSFRDAIEQKIISDYKIIVPIVKESELINMINRDEYLNVSDRVVDSENLFKQILLSKVINEVGIKKVITYHQSIKRAKNFIDADGGIGFSSILQSIIGDINESDIFASHINGRMSAGKRKGIFDIFVETPYGVISNARCLTEGVDVPIIDGIFFADSRNSVIDIIQAVGRSLRITDDKEKVSYIIIPIILSDEVSEFSEIDPQKFDTLHNIIQALRDQDRILADYINKLNLKLATGEGNGGGDGQDDIPSLIEIESIGITDISSKVLLRIAEVNKDSQHDHTTFEFTKGARRSGVRRGIFKTMGDYNMEAYYNNVVIKTMEKFDDYDIGKSRLDIKIDNNNVSHTERMGAIKPMSNKFYATPVGIMFSNTKNFEKDRPIIKEQLLKFFTKDPITHIAYFPYRFALKVLKEIKSLTKFEFAYSFFIAKNIDKSGVDTAIEVVSYLRDTFPNIEVLSSENRTIVLEALNDKYKTTFKESDIWAARTTVSNQYGYLRNHLSIFSVIAQESGRDIVIRKDIDTSELIDELLEKTSFVETSPLDQLQEIFINYQDWIK